MERLEKEEQIMNRFNRCPIYGGPMAGVDLPAIAKGNPFGQNFLESLYVDQRVHDVHHGRLGSRPPLAVTGGCAAAIFLERTNSQDMSPT